MTFKTINNFEDIYITSDLHLSDTVNRTISNRGFCCGEKHTEFIRNLINSKIKNRNSTLYILGDIGFRGQDDKLIEFFKSITPRVKVAVGNHDSEKQLKRLWNMGIIQDCKKDYKIRWNNYLFHLNHLPLLEWEGFFLNSFHFFGHCHGNQKSYLRAMDVGLDANNMQILNLYDLINMRKIYNNVDENKNKIELF